MMLFERMMQTPAAGAQIAADFAGYMAAAPDWKQIRTELAGILNRRKVLLYELERLEEEHSQRRTPVEDFAGVEAPTTATHTAPADPEEYEAAAKAIKDEIRTLNRFARLICAALYREGITATGGQISALTALGMPASVAAALDMLKRDKVAVLPPDERLTEQDAAAMFDGLAGKGLITGSKSDFIVYFGQGYEKAAKRLKRGLSWLGEGAQLAYFIARYSQIALMQTGQRGTPTYREKAFCRIFGIDERTRANTLRPYLSDFHAGHRITCKRSEEIAAVFNALPCLNIPNQDTTTQSDF